MASRSAALPLMPRESIFIRDGLKYYSTKVGLTTFQIDFRYQNLTPHNDGTSGHVVTAYDTLMQHMVVIKKIKSPLSQVQDMKKVLREIKLLRHFVGHENIASIYDIMTDPPDSPEFEDLYIVTNLFESDLGQIIKTNRTIFINHHYQFFLFQMLRALKYMHSANVIHRDLKPSNLLVTADCDLSICDFGLGRGVYNNISQEPLTQNSGARWYRAPEILCQSPYSTAVDIWSVGCIFAEMLTGTPFFKGDNTNQQLKSILNRLGCPPIERLNFITSRTALSCILNHRPVGTLARFDMYFPEGTSFIALDLLRRMLMFHPEDRITVTEALNHPYIKAFNDRVQAPVCPRPFNFNLTNMAHTPLPSSRNAEIIHNEINSTLVPSHYGSNNSTNNNIKEDTSHIDMLAAVSAMMALSNMHPPSSTTSSSSDLMEVESCNTANNSSNSNKNNNNKESFHTSSTSNHTATTLNNRLENTYNSNPPFFSSSSCSIITMKQARLLILQEVMWYRPMSLNIASYLVLQQQLQ